MDVVYQVAKASLVVSSEETHLSAGSFDVERMMAKLEDAVDQALADGYRGLWATGDMGWE
ncbi:MAG: MEDS domain-containing protein, partial [Acidobacteria bacterium]|nr:MEDS domain-containing protein [Acidobacteriota bacterium]